MFTFSQRKTVLSKPAVINEGKCSTHEDKTKIKTVNVRGLSEVNQTNFKNAILWNKISLDKCVSVDVFFHFAYKMSFFFLFFVIKHESNVCLLCPIRSKPAHLSEHQRTCCCFKPSGGLEINYISSIYLAILFKNMS